MTSIPAIKPLHRIQKDWYVYIIETHSGALYTGICTDMTRRLRQHKGEIVGGAKFLRGKSPLTIKGLWQMDNRSVASQCEAWIKKRSTQEKRALIAQTKDLPFPSRLCEQPYSE